MHDELLKTIRSAHLLSVAILFAGLVLLFAPGGVDYSAALNEARILLELDIGDYERYARGLIGSPEFLLHEGETNYAGVEIVHFLQSIDVCCLAPLQVNDWEIVPALQYQKPPKGEALSEWLGWINSTTPASYWVPNWRSAFVSLDTRNQSRPNDVGPRTVVFFSVSPVGHGLWLRPRYRFLAFFEDGLVEKNDGDWWRDAMSQPLHELWNEDSLTALDETGRSMVKGFVDPLGTRPVVEEAVTTGSVYAWLKAHRRRRMLLASDHSGFSALPELRRHWSAVSSQPVREAIAYMQSKQSEIRDVDLLGLSIPGALCLIAVPFGFLVAHTYLYMHLRALRTVLRAKPVEGPISFPWIGLYAEPLPRAVTGSSLTVLPTLLCVALVGRYYAKVDILSAGVAVVLIALFLVLGWMAAREVAELRRVR